MKKHRDIWVYLASTLVFTVLSACSDEHGKGSVGNAEIAMQSDEEVTASQGPMVSLTERPSFPVDEEKRQFAMIEDRDDKSKAASDKAISLEERSP